MGRKPLRSDLKVNQEFQAFYEKCKSLIVLKDINPKYSIFLRLLCVYFQVQKERPKLLEWIFLFRAETLS